MKKDLISVRTYLCIASVGALCLLSIYQNFTIDKQRDTIESLNRTIETLQEETQLDPCPVCDGHHTHVIHDDTYDISIKCDDCGTTFGFYQDLDSAIAIWNNVKG